jgi:hypothetical protein
MRKFRRPESLVVFNGEDPDGRKLSYETQFRTFRAATVVVGPHGSGPKAFGSFSVAHLAFLLLFRTSLARFFLLLVSLFLSLFLFL